MKKTFTACKLDTPYGTYRIKVLCGDGTRSYHIIHEYDEWDASTSTRNHRVRKEAEYTTMYRAMIHLAELPAMSYM